MPYRASWRLVGKEDHILDRGKLDGVHEHRAEALAEILAQLNQFALHGHPSRPRRMVGETIE